MRIFLAVDLPRHVKARLFHKFEVLRGKNLFRGKIIEKNNLHLTLKFFGNISNDMFNQIKRKLESFEFPKFDCRLGKIGVFDNEDHIKIIWFELVSDKFNRLGKEILDMFPTSKLSVEFVPHITIARISRVINKKSLLTELKKIKFPNLNFSVDKIVLMKSALTPKGPKYKILKEYSLR